ncbi:MAG: histidine kinase, partial [Chitinophagaceae bacterium]
MEKHIKIILFLITIVFSAHSQRDCAMLKIDSLKKILLTSKGTNRVDVLNLLSRPNLYGKHAKNITTSAQYYNDEALSLARNFYYKKGIANALLNEGIFLMSKDYASSLSSLSKALFLLKQENDGNSVAVCLYYIGWCMHTLGDNEKALAYYDSSQYLFKQLRDTCAAAWVMAWIGHSHFDLGNYSDAYKTGLQAWELTRETDTLLQTLSLAFLANLFLGAGLPEITIEYLHRILRFYPRIMEEKVLVEWPFSWALERGGEAFLQLNRVDSARKIAQVLAIPFEEQDVTNHLFYGHLYAALHQYQEALLHFKRGYLLAKQKAQISLSSHARELGRTYLALKNFREATFYSEQAFHTAQKIHALLEMRNAVATLTDLYDQTKNYSKAYYYTKLYKSLNDSLAPEEYKRKLSLTQVQNELQIQKQQMQLLAKENEVKQEQLKSESLLRNILIGSILSTILLGIFIFRSISLRNRLNQKLKAYELRSIISRDLHDEVGSTLSSIGFLSSMALEDANGREKVHNTLGSINESAHKMLDAMNDIIWNIQPENDSVNNIIVRLISFASETLEAQKITAHFKMSDDVKDLRLGVTIKHDFQLIYKEAI